MLNKWKCPKCGKVVTEYQTMCDSLACDGQRGFSRWLVNWDNPFAWIIGIFLFIGTASIILLCIS